MNKRIIPIDSIGEFKRDCQTVVENDYFDTLLLQERGKNRKYHQSLEEAGILDVVITAEDITVSNVIKREEPDFLLELPSNTIAVEVRRVDILDEEGCNNNQYARWGFIKSVIKECRIELGKYEEYKNRVINITSSPRLYDLKETLDKQQVVRALLSVVTHQEESNDYWMNVEIMPTILSGDASTGEESLFMSMLPSRHDYPQIHLNGILPTQNLTLEMVDRCIKDKEKLLPNYVVGLAAGGYNPSQYWLVMHIPESFIVSYDWGDCPEIESLYDRVYLVDIYYKQQIIRLK